jgi:hypothetical protein
MLAEEHLQRQQCQSGQVNVGSKNKDEPKIDTLSLVKCGIPVI